VRCCVCVCVYVPRWRSRYIIPQQRARRDKDTFMEYYYTFFCGIRYNYYRVCEKDVRRPSRYDDDDVHTVQYNVGSVSCIPPVRFVRYR